MAERLIIEQTLFDSILTRNDDRRFGRYQPTSLNTFETLVTEGFSKFWPTLSAGTG
jgi:hypothetical protein